LLAEILDELHVPEVHPFSEQRGHGCRGGHGWPPIRRSGLKNMPHFSTEQN
jgi:hypothetical protein